MHPRLTRERREKVISLVVTRGKATTIFGGHSINVKSLLGSMIYLTYIPAYERPVKGIAFYLEADVYEGYVSLRNDNLRIIA